MMKLNKELLYYKLHSEVKDPFFATKGSACFDLYSFIIEDNSVKIYLNQVEELEIKERKIHNGRVQVNPHERALIPTGLIFDIPRGYSIRLHPRSGLALKQGLTLGNNTGVIDWDYVEPVYVMIINVSGDTKYVNHNERICQGELFQDQPCVLKEANDRPKAKTEREGGFGSTGKG